MMLEKFEDFTADPTYDTFIILVCYQFWGFLSPFLKGVLDVVLKYIWDEGAISVNITTSTTVSVGYAQALGFVGIGNLTQLTDLFMEIMPKIFVNQILSGSSKLSYGTTADDTLKKLKIDL
mmetsp:Transcript_19799/g.24464  ORF Transcript_19799/g.24464 Transcript_19799/m.24464 type:complete len:121 (-) Transcript_19799:89-451(-)|eukprot:CAMPEP_0170464846 /NCGR_PEP_ID=MMETSP0123-20130129/9406_1 /TAXON_ID=182087 /ORGANISM="Favella ehrenbergii, Strain Fehren 1" /LENGTH=120 /DNA_ID=CAMNT_0010730583 /DNA_START=85 /DNA_END=447 /DNA_ORIENTATION=+